MLVVLSEVDCRSFLVNRKIYPDEFFMDIETFRHNLVTYSEADVIIIFGGMCSFRRRLVCEYITQLRSQLGDVGSPIKSLLVLSDSFLPNLKQYYKYDRVPTTAILHNGWDKAEKSITDPLKKYMGSKGNVNFHTPKHEAIKPPSKEALQDDELIKLIKVPEFVFN